MAGVAIGFDTLLSDEQNSVPVPREYNQARVLTELSSWENKQQKDHEHLKIQEGRAGLKFMMKVEDKNSRGVYKPICSKEVHECFHDHVSIESTCSVH